MVLEKKVFNLRNSLEHKGYCEINNILHSHLLRFLKTGSKLLESDLTNEQILLTQNEHIPSKNSLAKYSSFIGETLLLYLTPLYSKISGKNLIPTYSYYRKYLKNNVLKPHTDRPSCQYSATIQIDSDKNEPWPIWIKDKFGEIVECTPEIGGIVFYKGIEVEHWREELKSDYSHHLFLHWVDKNDFTFNKHWYDGRKGLNTPKN